MGRWEPNARGRLEQAAMALYAEHGFEQTTVADIAEQAGLTERTFFRYFDDKREVLFGGAEEVQGLLVDAVVGAPSSATSLEAVAAGLTAVATLLDEQRGRQFARRRHRIIASNDELRERELIKLANWATALADTLRARGIDESTANLAGEVGIAVFKTAFDRWISTSRGPKLSELLRDTLDDLDELSARTGDAAVARAL
jgi:AcrR family transcriptional regulator